LEIVGLFCFLPIEERFNQFCKESGRSMKKTEIPMSITIEDRANAAFILRLYIVAIIKSTPVKHREVFLPHQLSV